MVGRLSIISQNVCFDFVYIFCLYVHMWAYIGLWYYYGPKIDVTLVSVSHLLEEEKREGFGDRVLNFLNNYLHHKT